MKNKKMWKQRILTLALAGVLAGAMIPAGSLSTVLADEITSGTADTDGLNYAGNPDKNTGNSQTGAETGQTGGNTTAESGNTDGASGGTTGAAGGENTANEGTAGTQDTGEIREGENASCSVTLDKTELSLAVGDAAELQATVTPAGSDVSYVWKSGSDKVVTVQADSEDSEKASLKAVAAGTTKVSVSVTTSSGAGEGSTISAECTVTVKEKEQELRKESDGKLHFYRNGKADSAYTGFAEQDGIWYYVEKGAVSGTKTTVLQGSVNGINGWWYVRNSVLDLTYSGVEHNQNGWWRIENGRVNFGFNGFAENSNGWWYLKKGKVDFSVNSIERGTVNGQSGWWYIRNGKVDLGHTGVDRNANGWWYVKNGKVDFTHTGVEHNQNGWWYIQNGRVNFNYYGFGQNQHGWWYLEKGKVTFQKNSVIQGRVNNQSGWWYVKGSQVKFVNSVEGNSNGWWRIENGKVNFGFNGFAQNTNGWWYIRNGKVQFQTTSVIQGTVNGQSGWWYVKGGKVQFVSSVERNSNGWWRIENGKVNFGFNGIAQNGNGYWYIRNGKVDFNYTGNYTYNGTVYRVVKGKAYASDEGQMVTKAQQYTSSTGYLILVNKSTHKVGIFTGRQGNWSLKKYWSCATGANGKTPSGAFTIGRRWNYYDSSSGNRCWYCMEYKGHYLFHSVLCVPASHPIVRDGRVGVSISKGCIRLEIPNIKWMYDNIPRNTRVIIY